MCLVAAQICRSRFRLSFTSHRRTSSPGAFVATLFATSSYRHCCGCLQTKFANRRAFELPQEALAYLASAAIRHWRITKPKPTMIQVKGRFGVFIFQYRRPGKTKDSVTDRDQGSVELIIKERGARLSSISSLFTARNGVSYRGLSKGAPRSRRQDVSQLSFFATPCESISLLRVSRLNWGGARALKARLFASSEPGLCVGSGFFIYDSIQYSPPQRSAFFYV
jgi:hypothetical protein